MTDPLPTELSQTESLQSHHWSAILTARPEAYGWTEADFVARLQRAVDLAGLTVVNQTAFTFQPQGVSAVLLLAESHVAIHFWPEKGKITVDIHICDFHQDNKPKAEKLAHWLELELSETSAQWHCLSLLDE
ncbi:MAG: S-adenosylmethionine decarboxylase [Leptolyngbyaceae cyanobacterium bins.302]|nr:S-adenosylmethionine decarboxylase [Leptolyngbyaceae cyanobacterium bins.302]